ncbi:MAG: hypothetical protein K2L18_05550 [Acetatifactor sp.]|nr:hypothetical protein [Acetatifactor sp.]
MHAYDKKLIEYPAIYSARRIIAESKKQVTAFYKYKQWAVACFLFYKIYFEPDNYKKHDKSAAFAYRTVGTDRTFAYDDAGKLFSVKETEAGCGTCVYTYEYDLMGNCTAAVILTNVKIFQFPHSTCRIIGQHALCGKENLIVSEYKTNTAGTVVENRKYIYNESNQLAKAVL